MSKLNVFNYEPSASKANVEEKENNVTRAFLNTLKNNPDFFKKFMIKQSIKVDLKGEIEFEFQTNPESKGITRNRENKFFLIITKDPYKNDDLVELHSDGGLRADGLIFGETFAILIEAKVNAKYDQNQIDRYNKHYFNFNSIEKPVSWEEIHRFCVDYLTKISVEKRIWMEQTKHFIVNEFRIYLEDNNMSGFDGVEYFVPKTERDTYDPQRANNILKSLRYEYPEINPNIIPSDRRFAGQWDYFNMKGQKSGSHPQFQVSLNERGFFLGVMTDGNNLRKILDNYDEFAAIIEKLKDNPDYYLEIVDYHKLKNKRENKKIRQGDGYETFNFNIQLLKIFSNKDWENWLKQILILMGKSKFKKKNIQIIKHYLFNDEIFQQHNSNIPGNRKDMTNRELFLKEITKSIKELIQIHDLFTSLEK